MMKNFLAIFLGAPGSPKFAQFMAMEESKRKQVEAQGIKAWTDWMKMHSAVIVETGGPLGKTKKASAQGISDVKNNLSGYVVVKAESHDAAAKLFEKHPHFSIFPGDSVEIMEVLPIPGQKAD
jgi:transcription antitermination factor NusG